MNIDTRNYRVNYLVAGTSVARCGIFVAISEAQARLQARSWLLRQGIRWTITSVVPS